MPSTSLAFRTAAYAQETERTVIALLTIDHDDLATAILISTDPTTTLSEPVDDIIYGTVSRGSQFIFLPMRLGLPSDLDEGPGQVSIEIDNVHQAYTAAIRSIFTPPTVKIELVLDNAPDTVEASFPEFLMTNITYDAELIKGTLVIETMEREPFPCGVFSPSQFPGLFNVLGSTSS